MKKRTKVLCILDGFGIAQESPNNAAGMAKMPNFKRLLKEYWWTVLDADGESVGQERGLVGNSEVGHMNIGGLKLVPQLSYQITKSGEKAFDFDSSLAPDQIFDPKNLLTSILPQKDLKQKNVHLVGLFSTGTIHSDLRHWVGAIEAAGQSGAEKIIMHLISDGRDSDRQSLVDTWDYFVTTYQSRLKAHESKLELGSLGGRFYGMDRDKNQLRTAKAILSFIKLENIGEIKDLNYMDNFHITDKFINFFAKYDIDYHDLFEPLEFYRDNHLEKSVILGEAWLREEWQLYLTNTSFGVSLINLKEYRDQILVEYTKENYKNGIYDETLLPKTIENDNNGFGQGGVVWLINFRSDRMKQITKMLCDINNEFDLNLTILANNDYGIGSEKILDSNLTEFDLKEAKKSYFPIFKTRVVENTLAQTLSKLDKSQLHVAETEKYAHVTYFFNGGNEAKHKGEDWQVIPSNKVKSHGEMPEMKAKEIADCIIENGLGKYDYIIVNFANADMVGHTGDIVASIKSLEFLDIQLGRIIEEVEKQNHAMLITADHGNVEFVGEYEKNGKLLVDTEHNANSVPLIVIDKAFDTNNLKANLEKMQTDFNLNLDLDIIKKELESDNKIDLGDMWLDQNQIPTPKMPLWYSGVFLLGL